MHPLIFEHQITPKTSRYSCSMSTNPSTDESGSGQLGRWWYSISPCRNSEMRPASPVRSSTSGSYTDASLQPSSSATRTAIANADARVRCPAGRAAKHASRSPIPKRMSLPKARLNAVAVVRIRISAIGTVNIAGQAPRFVHLRWPGRTPTSTGVRVWHLAKPLRTAPRRRPTRRPLMHPLILEHQITPKTSRYTRCSMSMLPNVSINGRIRSSGQLGRWWYSISPCRNSECVRRFTVFAFNQRS